MAYIAKTAFEVYVSNSKRNDTQNITGKFGSFTGTNFTPDVCSAGFLCVKNSLLPNEGYESSFYLSSSGYSAAPAIKNGNSWYMTVATNGIVAGTPGDHTGLYACNTYDVNRAIAGDLVINVPGKTLGLSLPADERGDFTEIIIGEQYNFGEGNFSTLPSDTNKYVTVVNGLLVAGAAAPTTGAVYFEVMKTGRFTEGVYDAGAKYTLLAKRSVAAAAGA